MEVYGFSKIKKSIETLQKTDLRITNKKILKKHANQVIHINEKTIYFLRKKRRIFPKYELIEYPTQECQEANVVLHKINYIDKIIWFLITAALWFFLSNIDPRFTTTSILLDSGDHLPLLPMNLFFATGIFIGAMAYFFNKIAIHSVLSMKIKMQDNKCLELHLDNKDLIKKEQVLGIIKYSLKDKLTIENK